MLQPYRDLLRLLRKEVVLADNASWLFRVAPYLIFAATWVAAALVPTFATGLLFSWSADLIAIVALLGSARFFLALAGMDVGTSFGGIGSSREMMIASARRAGDDHDRVLAWRWSPARPSFPRSRISCVSSDVGLRVSLGLALVALVMVAIAENARIPVDNPATHLELTMVHEAMVLEYSGRHLAMIELGALPQAAALHLADRLRLRALGLAPFGAGPSAYAHRRASPISVKLAVAGFLLALFETAIAKMRVFRVPRIPGRGADAGPARHAAAVRVEELLMRCTASPSTSPICSPAGWCWSAS